MVDAALQGVAAFDDLSLGTMVPVAVDTVRRHGPTPTTPVTAVIRRGTGPDVYADIAMCGPDGTAFFELLGVRFAELTPSPSPLAELGPLLYEIDWCPVDPAAIGVRVDQPVLQVALGSQAAEPQAPPPDCAALIQPMYLAHTIRQLGEPT